MSRPFPSLLLAAVLLAVHTVSAQDAPKLPRVVTNPARTFWEEIKTDDPDVKVFQFKMDFDLDGREDVAYVDQRACGVHGLCGLTIFLRRADGKFIELQTMEANTGGDILLRRNRRGGSTATHWVYGSGGNGDIVTCRISKRGLKELRKEGINTREEDDRGIKRLRAVFGETAPKLDARMTVLTRDEFLAQAGVRPEPAPVASAPVPVPSPTPR